MATRTQILVADAIATDRNSGRVAAIAFARDNGLLTQLDDLTAIGRILNAAAAREGR